MKPPGLPTRTCSTATFPRREAAASLKQAESDKASLEAMSFPRREAAASLKHEAAQAVVDALDAPFPRREAAASLKRRVHDKSLIQLGDFSAARGRGLIEAHSFSGVVRAPISLFRGERPRPH